MTRTLWFTVAALAAALALTAGAPVASGGGDGCPGQYDQHVLSINDAHGFVDENGNGYICEYVGKNASKETFIDDNHKPPAKVQGP